MGRPLRSKNKMPINHAQNVGRGAANWWARMTPQERSQEMIRRQAIARRKREARLQDDYESPADRKRRLDRERKRITRQASTRSPFPDTNPTFDTTVVV